MRHGPIDQTTQDGELGGPRTDQGGAHGATEFPSSVRVVLRRRVLGARRARGLFATAALDEQQGIGAHAVERMEAPYEAHRTAGLGRSPLHSVFGRGVQVAGSLGPEATRVDTVEWAAPGISDFFLDDRIGMTLMSVEAQLEEHAQELERTFAFETGQQKKNPFVTAWEGYPMSIELVDYDMDKFEQRDDFWSLKKLQDARKL